MIGGTKGAVAPIFITIVGFFESFNASSENFRTLAVGKDEGFEFYRKIIELALLLSGCHDAPASGFFSPLLSQNPTTFFDRLYRKIFINVSALPRVETLVSCV